MVWVSVHAGRYVEPFEDPDVWAAVLGLRLERDASAAATAFFQAFCLPIRVKGFQGLRA